MGFQCRQFYIKDDQCAMKVSTDSLLFGSYVPVVGVKRALDMGTGSGLLALMLAQRAPQAYIDGFDADAAAIAQARQNVLTSPWPQRIQLEQQCVSAWQSPQPYDLIVCNPPYFANHLASAQDARALARQGQVAPSAWLKCAARSLCDTGTFYWVLPTHQAEQWQALAEAEGFYLGNELRVQTTVKKTPKLVVQGWQLSAPQNLVREALVIHAEDGSYSEAYRRLTGEFYLAGQNF